MSIVRPTDSIVGRAKAALVFHGGDENRALITNVVCQPDIEVARIRFSGPGGFEEKTREHICGVVWLCLRALLKRLGVVCPGFTISVVNLSAASWDHRGLAIAGFSADTPLFLAMLSAALNIPVPQDLLATGHIASPDGDIRVVGSLPAKLAAVSSAGGIKRFIYPDLSGDNSLDALLSENEVLEVHAAIAEAKRFLFALPVRDVGDLIKAIITDEQLVLAGLVNGYFMNSHATMVSGDPIGQATRHLTDDLPFKFWSVLESRMLAGQDSEAKMLLQRFLDSYLGKSNYPSKFGGRLYQLLASVPQQIRRLKIKRPLLPVADCIKLAQYAGAGDVDDVTMLFKAVGGDVSNNDSRKPEIQNKSEHAGSVDDPILESVLSLIRPSNLADRISSPIDNARATYLLDSVIVDGNDAFNEIIYSFYLHLMRHARGVEESVPTENVGGDALALLERSFARDGGVKGALTESRLGLKGGMRFVLDVMTEQFKKEEWEKEVNRVLLEAVDPADWNGQVAFIKALMSRLHGHLPEDILAYPPEKYGNHVQVLARAYVESLDKLHLTFRSL